MPILGDIPIVNFFFKSKETKKERSSLIFVVTPTSYDPSSVASHQRTSSRLGNNMQVDSEDDWVDLERPKPIWSDLESANSRESDLQRNNDGVYPQRYK